jgi:1-deoxy-D-xylulose-5-phosphate synthase
MPSGCSLKYMLEAMPDRAFDVGIAEQHAVTFSAGMATQGKVPFCNIYSTFMQRAYDQVVHDVATQNLHVVFCLDRGGLVGADGPTHHGAFDMAYMRCIPNMVVAAPMDEVELRNMMYTAAEMQSGPFSIRYPRGTGTIVDWRQPFKAIQIGQGRKLKSGDDIAILSIGAIGSQATDAIETLESRGVSAAHYDMRFVKPLDEIMLHEIFGKFNAVITIEDGCLMGGFGSAVTEFMGDNGYQAHVKRLGLGDHYVEHGTQGQLYAENNYDADAIVKTAEELVSTSKANSQTVQSA